MSDETPSPLAVAETAAFVVIGAVAELQRCLPAFVSAQKSKWDQQVVLARFLGQMAVGQARQEIRRRLTTSPAPRDAADSTMTAQPTGTGAASGSVSQPATGDEALDVSALAIDHYDELSASQVIDRLAYLDAGQLDAVHHYESRHRRRRTVLGRVEQLRSGLAGSSD